MKRGLKDGRVDNVPLYIGSYNRYPDEKGTESATERSKRDGHLVTTVTPMKRGLKVILARRKHGHDSQLQPLPR